MKRVSLPSIVERPLSRGKTEARTQECFLACAWLTRFAPAQVSLSAFAFLFSELVQYNQSRVSNSNELERRRALWPRLASAPSPADACRGLQAGRGGL
jgi:hypothetical protein